MSLTQKKPSSFPFNRLSTELAVEIIRHASTANFTDFSSNAYSNSLTICLVSHAVRQAAMPQLLHTVLLSDGHNVHSFIRAIHIQRTHHQNGSRLAVNYSMHVRRMWCGTCWEALVDEPGDSPSWLDYGALWDVMRNVESLGMYYQSLHLLYNGLATDVDAAEQDEAGGGNVSFVNRWKCRKITFAGDYCQRWRPLTSTREGSAFLASITHLVLWMPDHQPGSTKDSKVTPRWMERVPFGMMKSLTDVGFALSRRSCSGVPSDSLVAPTEMLVYHLPKYGTTGTDSASLTSEEHDPMTFRQWAVDDMDPVSHGLVLPLNIEARVDRQGASQILDWEKAWASGQSEYS